MKIIIILSGGASTNFEFKLEYIHDIEYYLKDKHDKVNQIPIGEVLLRGPGVFKGYYKD